MAYPDGPSDSATGMSRQLFSSQAQAQFLLICEQWLQFPATHGIIQTSQSHLPVGTQDHLSLWLPQSRPPPALLVHSILKSSPDSPEGPSG